MTPESLLMGILFAKSQVVINYRYNQCLLNSGLKSLRKPFVSTIYKILFYVILSIVTVMFLMPASDIPDPHINDKLLHGLIFFGLAFLIHFAYPEQKFLIVLAPFLMVYGLLIEVLQGYSGYRMFSLLDWGADILGIVLYASIAGVVMHHSVIGDSQT